MILEFLTVFLTFFPNFRLTAVLLRNGPSNIIFFGCRDPLRSVLPESLEKFSLLADFLSGACLGAFISTIFYPLNTTKTHMQVMCETALYQYLLLNIFRNHLEENSGASVQFSFSY